MSDKITRDMRLANILTKKMDTYFDHHGLDEVTCTEMHAAIKFLVQEFETKVRFMKWQKLQ